jgi:hypothetical protein
MLLTPYFAISYALSFAALSSILVHVYLWHWEEIKEGQSCMSPKKASMLNLSSLVEPP